MILISIFSYINGIESDDMELCEPIVMQSSLSSMKYMEDLIEHEPVDHMETFYATSGIVGCTSKR